MLSSALKRSSMWILSMLREYSRMGCLVSVRVSLKLRNSLGTCSRSAVRLSPRSLSLREKREGSRQKASLGKSAD